MVFMSSLRLRRGRVFGRLRRGREMMSLMVVVEVPVKGISTAKVKLRVFQMMLDLLEDSRY
jgi:hypothetical protein